MLNDMGATTGRKCLDSHVPIYLCKEALSAKSKCQTALCDSCAIKISGAIQNDQPKRLRGGACAKRARRGGGTSIIYSNKGISQTITSTRNSPSPEHKNMCNHCIDQKKIYDPDAVLAYLATKDPCPLVGPTDLKNIGTSLCPKNFIAVKNKGGGNSNQVLEMQDVAT